MAASAGGALARNGVAHDGQVATRLGPGGDPGLRETIALSTILLLAREAGAKVHLCRLSSAEASTWFARQRPGYPVTCDVAIHHVHLSEMDIGYFDPNCHLTPPLRSARRPRRAAPGARRRTIDAICSDHAPVDEDVKQLPFAEAEIGATGLELLLPLTLKWADESGVALSAALAKITSDAARILAIDAGHLSPGSAADICVFDPERYWKVAPAALKSQGKNTPFLGLELKGRVRQTLVEGQIVYEAK